MVVQSGGDGKKVKLAKKEEEGRVGDDGVGGSRYLVHPIVPKDVRSQLLQEYDGASETVPLGLFIDRLVVETYSQLTELAELLPGVAASQGELARKKRLIDWILARRRQFVKSLVVLRWAKEIGAVESRPEGPSTASHTENVSANWNVGTSLGPCRSIVRFLHHTNDSLIRVVQRFAEIQKELQAARVRAAEIEGAINILCADEPGHTDRPIRSRLPKVLQDEFIPKVVDESLSKETLDELDRRIHYRLALDKRSKLPRRWQHYSVQEGKVTFRSSRRYQVILTTTDRAEDAPWQIVDCAMLSADNDSSSELFKAQFQYNVFTEGANLLQDQGDDKKQSPIRSFHNFVDKTWSTYLMDSLAAQFNRMSASRSLKIKIRSEGETPSLLVEYWTNLPWGGNLYPGETEVMMKKWTAADRGIGQWRSRGILSIGVEFGKVSDENNVLDESRFTLTWGAAAQNTTIVEPTSIVLKDAQLEASTLLSLVIKLHTRNILEHFYTGLTTRRSIGHIKPENITRHENRLKIRLHGSLEVVVSIHSTSGKIDFDTEVATDAKLFSMVHTSPKLLDMAVEKVNSNPRLILDLILRLKWQAIMGNVQSQITASVSNLERNVHQSLGVEEQRVFGTDTRFILLYQLDRDSPNYNLALVLTDEGIKYKLIELKRKDQGANIQFAINTMDDIKCHRDDFIIDPMWLRRIYDDSIQRIRFRQLRRDLSLISENFDIHTVYEEDVFSAMDGRTACPILALKSSSLLSWQCQICDSDILFDLDLAAIRMRLKPESRQWQKRRMSRDHIGWDPESKELTCQDTTSLSLAQCLYDLVDSLWMNSIEDQTCFANSIRGIGPLLIKEMSLYSSRICFEGPHCLVIERLASVSTVRIVRYEDDKARSSVMDIFSSTVQSTLERDPCAIALVLAILQHWTPTVTFLRDLESPEVVLALEDLYHLRVLLPGSRRVLKVLLAEDWKLNITDGVQNTFDSSVILQNGNHGDGTMVSGSEEIERCSTLASILEAQAQKPKDGGWSRLPKELYQNRNDGDGAGDSVGSSHNPLVLSYNKDQTTVSLDRLFKGL